MLITSLLCLSDRLKYLIVSSGRDFYLCYNKYNDRLVRVSKMKDAAGTSIDENGNRYKSFCHAVATIRGDTVCHRRNKCKRSSKS